VLRQEEKELSLIRRPILGLGKGLLLKQYQRIRESSLFVPIMEITSVLGQEKMPRLTHRPMMGLGKSLVLFILIEMEVLVALFRLLMREDWDSTSVLGKEHTQRSTFRLLLGLGKGSH